MTNMEYEQYIKNSLLPLVNDNHINNVNTILADKRYNAIILFTPQFYTLKNQPIVANIIADVLNKNFLEYVKQCDSRYYFTSFIYSIIFYDINLHTTLSQQLLNLNDEQVYKDYQWTLLEICIQSHTTIKLNFFIVNELINYMNILIQKLDNVTSTNHQLILFDIANIFIILYPYIQQYTHIHKILMDNYIKINKLLYKLFQQKWGNIKSDYFITHCFLYKEFKDKLSISQALINDINSIDILLEMIL